MPDKPTILERRIVARSRLFEVEELALRFGNGAEARFERLRGSGRGSVLVVPVLEESTLLLVREYAAGVHRYELGFPKGLVEEGETPLQAANREIMEEVGYASGDLESLSTVTVAPGYLEFRTELVLARELSPRRLPGDEPEPLEVVPWPMSRGRELLLREDFTEARSIAALFLVLERYGHGL